MADENNEEVEQPKKGNPMMIVLIILVVALIGAVGFLGYMVMNKMNQDTNPTEQNKKEEAKKEEAKDEGIYFKSSIKDLVLNITNSKGREKLMKLSFTLKSTEESIPALVEQSKDEIIDAVIQQVAAMSSEELLTVGGKDLFREELLNEINIIINEATSKNEDIKRNNIQKIYFTTFVIK